MKADYNSLVVTGDPRGFEYLKKTITELPGNAFNFCCTVDGGLDREQEYNMYQMRPEKQIMQNPKISIIKQANTAEIVEKNVKS